ncbi:hypothetical protein BT63DRAFT_227391 [Microthyrium microscopicum]|uniref:Uncharacterized protein n=1 Tax=Microthyrium microscopicum TaxID=703497 RepID=A0A6A6UCW0_9PEZI|nr:hypothetical protein BT63DRAFT_227391 [Microthyrium microscopicum]
MAPSDPPNPLPEFIYKIHLPAEDFNYKLSDFDRVSGFIHLSVWEQVFKTADRFFANDTSLVIQRIQIDKLKAKGGNLEWEYVDGAIFPHWFFEPLDQALVGLGDVATWTRKSDVLWEGAFDGTSPPLAPESR